MLDFGLISSEVPKQFLVPNMLLIAGAGQNVGKTSFAVAAIYYLKSLGYKVYGLKITPHFHDVSLPYLIIKNDNFQISLEKDKSGIKDSSRMLNAGADEVFFVQTKTDDAISFAFDFVNRMANDNIVWICESGGLRNFVKPGLFLYFKLKGENPQKKSAKQLMPLADRIVEFDGEDFDFEVEKIMIVDNKFKIA